MLKLDPNKPRFGDAVRRAYRDDRLDQGGRRFAVLSAHLMLDVMSTIVAKSVAASGQGRVTATAAIGRHAPRAVARGPDLLGHPIVRVRLLPRPISHDVRRG